MKSYELATHQQTEIEGLKKLTRKKVTKMTREPKLLRALFLRSEVSKFFD